MENDSRRQQFNVPECSCSMRLLKAATPTRSKLGALRANRNHR